MVEVADLHRRLHAPRIAVLGPVEIHVGDTRRSVPVRPARLLLALVSTTRPLTLEGLANFVWDDDPPLTHRAALHVHLGTVRRLLDESGSTASIARAGDRYSLHLGGCEVDSILATDLVQACRILVDDDPPSAGALISWALTLWRGAPFSVEGDVVDVAAYRQAERLRREAEELSVDCLLAVGDVGAAEDLAARLVDEEPLRERRWEQLLRARARAGRTAEALATYQDARRTLVESLGIEPGTTLRELEADVLTGDLRPDHAGTPREPISALRPPPAPAGELVGREHELRALRGRVARSETVAVIGPPGVGKTRLALEVIHDMDDVAWVDAREARLRAAAAVIHDWVRAHPEGAVVFDNAEAELDDVADIVCELRSHAPGVAVLVTTRAPIGLDAAIEVLGPLGVPADGASDEEVEATPAVRALRAAFAELAPATALPTDEAARIARRSGGLPLVLRLIAAAARALPVAVLAARTTAAEVDEIDRSVEALLAAVGDSARRAFLDLATVTSSFDLSLVRRLTNLSADALDRVIVDLVDHGLVQSRPDDAAPYSVLPPLREAADRALTRAGRRPEVLDRLADACIGRARELDATATEGSAVDAALERFVPLAHATLEHLAARGDADRALTLACWLERPLYIAGWWQEKLELFDAALAIPGTATTMRARAHVYRARPGFLHQLDPGHAAAADVMASELGHGDLLAYARHVRSIIEWWNGRHPDAIALAREAADRFAAAGRTAAWTEANKFVGVAMVFAGDVAGGIGVQQDNLEVARREVDNPFLVAHHLAYLAHSQRMIGDDEAASADWTEALDLCRRIGNGGTAVHVAIGLADLAVDEGAPGRALQLVAEALGQIRAGRAWAYEPWAWTVAVRAHHTAGEHDLVRRCAARALEHLPRVPPGEAARLAAELAHVAAARGQSAVAARLLAVTRATATQRELPFVPMREVERRRVLDDALSAEVDAALASHPRLSVREAAGSLLA